MKKAEHIFHRALEIDDPEERSEYIDQACEGDRLLEGQVHRFIQLHLTANQLFPTEPGSTTLDIQTDALETLIPKEKPGTRIGHYKLLQIIGEGGFGVVWMAEQVAPIKRRVALKIIKLGMDTREIIARFEAERQALAMMDHPNIAKVFDAGSTETGRPYFVMELVKGIPVTKYCDEHQLEARQRLELFIDICSAIHHAHQKGIIHRDIKPSNVLVTMHGDKPVPKVIDFGIAKATQCELTEKTVFTRFEQFIGTPVYMSPEQAVLSGLDIDTRSDIYSLGVLLYELITGKTPFDSKSLLSSGYDEMRRIIKEEDPPKPSIRLKSSSPQECTTLSRTHHTVLQKLCSIVKGELDWIVMKSMEKDRARRYETAHDLALDISNFLSNKAVMAAEPSYGYRFRKFARRNQGVLSATLSIFVLLAVGTSVSIWQAVLANRAKNKAESAEKAEKGQRLLAQQNENKAIAYAETLRLNAYIADMSAAQQAIDEGNFQRARSILNQHVPINSQEDLRGFEWRYLWKKSQSQEMAVIGSYTTREGEFGGVDFSPDGKLLAHLFGGGIQIRSIPDGKLIQTLVGVSGPTLQFLPKGNQLLVEDQDGINTSIRRWNTADWRELPPLKGLGSPFTCSGNGKVLAARSDDQMEIWNLDTASKLQTLPGALSELNIQRIESFLRSSIAMTRDGTRLYMGSSEGEIHAWNLLNFERLLSIHTGIPDYVVDLSIATSGLLAAAHYTGKVTLWDSATQQGLGEPLSNHIGWVSSVQLSEDGSVLASASADHTIYTYDLVDGRPGLNKRRLAGHGGEIWGLSMSSDLKWLATGSPHDQSVRLWDMASASSSQPENQLRLPLEFDEKNRLISWDGLKGFIRLDIHQEKETAVENMQVPATFPLEKLTHGPPAFQQLRHRIAKRRWLTDISTRGVDIWDLTTVNPQPAAHLPDTGLTVTSTCFSSGGSLFATASSIEGLRIWNTGDWHLPPRLWMPDLRQQAVIRFSSDTSLLASFTSQSGILLDTDSGQIVMKMKVDDQVIGSIAFSKKDRYLAVGTYQNWIHIWDLQTRQKIHKVKGHVAGIRAISFSPDERTLVSCADSRIKLWNVISGREYFTLFKASAEPSWPLFSPDGTWLVSGSVQPGLTFFRAASWEDIP